MKRVLLLGDIPGVYEDDRLVLSPRAPKLWSMFKKFFDQIKSDELVPNKTTSNPINKGNLDAQASYAAVRSNICNLNKRIKPEMEIVPVKEYPGRYQLKVLGKVECDLFNFFKRCDALSELKENPQQMIQEAQEALNIIQNVSGIGDLIFLPNEMARKLINLIKNVTEAYKQHHSPQSTKFIKSLMEKLDFVRLDIKGKVEDYLYEELMNKYLELKQDYANIIAKKPIISKPHFLLSGRVELNTRCNAEVNLDGWTRRDCRFELLPQKNFDLDAELKRTIKDAHTRSILKQHIEKRWEELMQKERIFLTNKQSYGLYEYQFSNNSHKLFFKFKLTSYKHFIGTNKSLDVPLKKPIKGKYKTLREYIRSQYPDEGECPFSNNFFRSSFLSNRLGTATAVVTEDNYLIITRGGASKAVMPFKYMVLAEGMVHNWYSKGRREHDKNDPFNTILRGAKQELLLSGELTKERIRILAVGLYCDFLQPFIWAYAEASCPANVIIERHSQRLEPKKWDVETMMAVPFNPRELTKYLVQIDRWSPPQAFAVYLALCYRYGQDEVNNYIKLQSA